MEGRIKLEYYVAKSYADLEKLSSVFEKDGRQYIKIKLASGNEKDVRAYYENNAMNIDMTLYVHCLKELQKVIEESKEIMDMSIIIPALYEITGVKGKKNQRKFFWDVFSWEDLQPLVSRKG